MNALIILALIGMASAFVPQEEWAAFKAKHGKSYSNPLEELKRMKIYAEHKAYVEQHQREYVAGLHTFEVELNKFADLSTSEWSEMFKGYKHNLKIAASFRSIHENNGKPNVDTKDWRTQGAVTPVRDQGQCGSSWAISPISAVEGAWKIAGHPLVSLSVQQLIDCFKSDGNHGCQGGNPVSPYKYIEQVGLMKEEDYPSTNNTCEVDKSKLVVKISGYKNVKSGSEADLQDAISNKGPTAAGIDASHTSFQLYKSGIYHESSCRTVLIDHSVLVVGYGSEGDKNYWIVKNSWGINWGMKGYINMIKDDNNNCGIASAATYPII